MTSIPKTAIIGLGLIGGSLALALKRIGVSTVGIDCDQKTVEHAKKIGLTDFASSNINDIKGCGLVVVAVPVGRVREIVVAAHAVVGQDALITDVGSTKRNLADLTHIRLVGGHPMCGTEFSGIKNIVDALFEKKYYIIVPFEKSQEHDIKTVETLATLIGAKTVFMDYELHDSAVANISHLPHMAAYALADAVSDDAAVRKIGGSGFLDTTRIASSNADFWASVALINGENIINQLNAYERSVANIKQLIANGDYNGLVEVFSRAKQKRDGVLNK